MLGVFLLIAAGLKAYGLAFDPLSQDSFLASPRLLIATIGVEILLGLWLLSGWSARAAWVAALGFFGILAGVAGTFTGKWLRPIPAEVSLPSSPLYADARLLDFGEAWETDRFVWLVRVHNPGPGSARVTTMTASCNCVSSGSVSEVIPPGQSRDIPFEVDLRNQCASAEPRESRDVELRLAARVEPASAIPSAPWVLRGRVRAAVAVPVRSVDFGRLAATSFPKPQVIPIRALTDLSRLDVTAEGTSVVAELQPTPDPRRWDLVVGRAAWLPVGRYTTGVKLCPVTRAGEAATPVRIPVEFDILGDVQADAPAVVMGCCRVGDVAEGRVTLTLLSGRAFRVTGRTADPSGGVEIVQEDAAGSSQSFSVRQKVTALGDNTGALHFRGQDADGMQFEVVVEARCFGTNAP